MPMNIVNEPVRHRQFGSGTITEQTVMMVTVEFCEEHGSKKFLYPSAFETFLELSNPIVKQKMDDKLREIREREELEQQRADEEERRQEEERRILLEQKRKAVKSHYLPRRPKEKNNPSSKNNNRTK
jgi:hypothetical protein